MTILVGLTSVIVNFIANMDLITHIANAAVVVIFGCLFYLTRFKKYYQKTTYIFIVLGFIFLDLIWITSGGLDSPMVLYIFLATICFIIMVKTEKILIISVLCVVNLFFLLIIEKTTNWVVPYPTPEVRFYDYGLSALIILFLISLLIRMIKLAYEVEKEKALKRNEQVELLLKKLHHRVKNNLQLVSSLLGLQSQKLEDGEAKKAIQIGKDRVRVMGNIHKYLYKEENSTEIKIKDYIEELTNELLAAYNQDNKVCVIINIDDVQLSADFVLPLGLIINEAFTNSLKYAFTETKNPKIEITFKANINECNLEINDNGSGIKNANFDELSNSSLGTKLIKLLAQHLNGSLTIHHVNGMCYNINFPIHKKK